MNKRRPLREELLEKLRNQILRGELSPLKKMGRL
jgi:DNA-binding GntR family transcriptional regulator